MGVVFWLNEVGSWVVKGVIRLYSCVEVMS